MILIDDTVISSDIADEFFVCDLAKCKGACCVEGDLGAPLEEEELEILERIQDDIKPFLSEIGLKEIEKSGAWVKDDDGHLKCGIEQAYFAGKTDFRKPISCHLYPIRLAKLADYTALNYDRWSICSDACSNGASLGVPIYVFLKQPLIRKFGEKWYGELCQEIEERKEE